jgi:4-carboxymuconolactone decarboxylase
MTDRPRIAPVGPDEQSDAQQALLAPLQQGPVPAAVNLFTTIVRHPRLFRRWQALGGTLLFRGALPDRDREILILRTAVNTRSDYEWGQHVRIASEAGMSDDEIERCAAKGPRADDEVLIAAADELHHTSTIGDSTWARLTQRYDEEQLIELVALVGYYHQVAYLLNALRVEREEGVVALPPDPPSSSS